MEKRIWDSKKSLVQWLALSGVIGTAAYFLHVVVGKMNYPGYSSLAQAISDLTAADSPSREIASAFSTIYGLFTVTAMTLLCVFFQNRVNKVFRMGIYLFAIMQWVTAVGYTLFSLSTSGYAGMFQDVMHVVVTVAVVLLSIASMILLAVGAIKSGAHKLFGIFTIAALVIMAAGSIGTGAAPIEYFGVAERVSVYSVVVYSGFLPVFAFCFSANTNE